VVWGGRERKRGGRLTDPEDLHRIERGLEPERGADQDEREAGCAGGELEGEEVLDVVEDGFALFDGVEDGREIVVGQNHVRCFLGNVSAVHSHGDANIGLFERWRIVDPVSRHGDNIAAGLKGSDDLQLVIWVGSCEDGSVVHCSCEVLFGHGVDLVTSQDRLDGDLV
jgi:hypothetical protein